MGWGINIYDLVRVLVKKPCNGYYLRWYYNGWHYWFFHPGQLILNTEGEKYYTLGTRKVAMGTGQITRGQAIGIRTIMMTREVYLLTIAGWMNIRIEPGSLIVYDNKIAGAEIEFIAIIGSKEISYDTGFTPIPFVPVITPDTLYCEVIIGSQIWMCKNYDTNYPGSKVYNDDEANRLVYGGLYTFDQVKNPGFCPSGWHIPTLAEWTTLINFLGTTANVGGYLKEAGLTHWDAPNTGAVDSAGFAAVGNGFYIYGFGGLNLVANLWTTDEVSISNGYLIQMGNTTAAITALSLPKSSYFGVRLLKNIPAPPYILDIDGNVYHYVTIGAQQWFIEPLKTTKLNDGTPIPNLTNDAAWKADVVGAYCWYDNDITNKAVWGALYNWYATQSAILAPTGWRVPTMADFMALSAAIGGDAIAGGKLKEAGLVHWNTPNTGATDDYGFKGLPCGRRDGNSGVFIARGDYAWLWSSDESVGLGYCGTLQYNSTIFDSNDLDQKWDGFQIHCMRDVP